MRDMVTADYIYLLPLETELIIKILEERQIDAVLPSIGGKTALNLAIDSGKQGIWEECGGRNDWS